MKFTTSRVILSVLVIAVAIIAIWLVANLAMGTLFAILIGLVAVAAVIAIMYSKKDLDHD